MRRPRQDPRAPACRGPLLSSSRARLASRTGRGHSRKVHPRHCLRDHPAAHLGICRRLCASNARHVRFLISVDTGGLRSGVFAAMSTHDNTSPSPGATSPLTAGNSGSFISREHRSASIGNIVHRSDSQDSLSDDRSEGTASLRVRRTYCPARELMWHVGLSLTVSRSCPRLMGAIAPAAGPPARRRTAAPLRSRERNVQARRR